MSATTSPPSPPPTVLAQRYRLDRRLAQGGMAEVWVATDLQLSRQVAVKLLKPTLAHDPVVAERFRREAIAVAQLNHPNIVAVYDAIEESGRQAVVMQLISGKSLRQLLDDQKRLSPDLTMHIGACVAAALDAAHQAGMVHRDVKPGNILITPDGRVLLTDFGIAKGLEPSVDDDLTNDNIMMGTAKYLSPEQVRGRRLDGRADLYSLGLVLYECLAGRVPFLGQNDADTALARLQRDPTDITRLRPTLPRGLPELIHRLLARRPDQRYASGTAVRAAIAEIQSRPPEPALSSEYTLSAPRVLDATPRSGNPATGSPVGPSGRPPQAVGGYQPVRSGAAAARTGRDRTPTGAQRVRQQPNRRYQQRRGPSLLLVGALLLTAAVLVAVLVNQLGDDDAAGFVPPTTVDPAAVVTTPAPATPLVGTAIASVTAFDPDGDGEENDDQAAAAVDGDPSTGWNTVCYSSEYLGGKGGVGLVATFDALAAGTLTIDIASAPWIVEVYASTGEATPASIGDWGESIASANATAAKTLEVPLLTPARHVLVLMRQLGASDSCSGDNPYRGTISELRFAATG
jgi:serine/threonine-protein kinase